MVRAAIRKAEKEYLAHISYDEFVSVYRMRDRDPSLKIPGGMTAQLLELGGTAAAEIKRLDNKFRVDSRRRNQASLQVESEELLELEAKQSKKVTKTTEKAIAVKLRKIQKLQEAIEAPAIATSGDYRIYPMYFAPIIIQEGGRRLIVPARYQIKPRWGGEITGTFNARRDSLQVKKTWMFLFGKRHAIFPFLKFYEWVGSDDAKREISFSPDGYESMWAASLYDEFELHEAGLLRSFAMITDDPPPEVSAAGHDRCPVFLREDLIDAWLTPEGKNLDCLDSLLAEKQRTYFSNQLAA